MVERPVVLYVAGEGRSGSTLLGRMLHRIDGVVHVGEIVHLWVRGVGANEHCACGVAFDACPFWQAVGTRAYGAWDGVGERMRTLQRRVDRQRYIPLLLSPTAPHRFSAALRAYGAGLTTLYRAIQQSANAQVIVDTSKHASMAFVLSRVPDVDLRILHLVRDSRGVSNSWTRTVRRPEVTSREALMPTYRPARTAGRWVTTNLELEMLRATGTPVARVGYEALVSAPEATLRSALTTLGLDLTLPADLVAGGRVELVGDHSVAGNPLRFHREAVVLRLDEAWHRELGRVQRTAVTALTWPLLRRYGYVSADRADAPASGGDPALAALLPVLGADRPSRNGHGDRGRPYGMLPSRERPRLVVPLAPGAVAASAVRRSSVGSRMSDRVGRSLLALSLQAGLGQLLIRDRVWMEFGADALSAWLRDATEGQARAVSVRLGTRRPNSKPVLQVMAADGEVLGYAKVGWNDLTRRLVDREIRVLQAITGRCRLLEVPRVLAADAVRGLHVVLLSVIPTRGRTRRAFDSRLAEALVELAGLGEGRCSEPLARSRFVDDLRTRIAALTPGTERDGIGLLFEQRVAEASSTRLDFGFSHGDFTPWNTALRTERTSVWDWERARDAVPVGFDALQYWLQIALHRRGLDVPAAVSAARQRANAWLARLGVDPVAMPLLSDLHVTELVVRYMETAPHDRTDAVTRWCQAALTYLEEDR